MVKIAPYGTWVSPLGAADVARADSRPRWVRAHGPDTFWVEDRPADGGRVTLVRHDGARVRELTPAPWNVRNRVHEYGGLPYLVMSGRVVFTHWVDQRLYLTDLDGAEPRPITPEPNEPQGLRYTDLVAGPDGTEVWCVREDHDNFRELVAVPLDGGEPRVLGRTHHFMSGPKPSPDGRHVAWLGWEHPAMPWDGTELCVAAVTADGTLGAHRVVAGGPRESVCQVEWESADALLVLTDPDGWWNLRRIGVDGAAATLAPGEYELGGPLWQLGYRWFAPLGRGRYAVLRDDRLAVLDERSGTVTDVETDLPLWTHFDATPDGVVVGAAGGPREGWRPVRLDLSTGELVDLAGAEESAYAEYLPEPVARSFDSPDGYRVPAYAYPPTNPDFAAPDGELPPYVVYPHSGPTSRVTPARNLDIAYFTSRGIGVVEVDYAGSTGYGRAFRELLNGAWGVADVRDCATVARALVAEGTADPRRLAIRGGSAGGWTAAAAITTVDVFACAAISFPILDLSPWAEGGVDSHDFESRYVEGLVGSLPEHRERYLALSPINHVDTLAGPVLLLQGLDDPVCPPAQANRFVAALDGTGVPHAYLTFEGESHGFRRAETIVTAHEAELSFYGQVFGFDTDAPTLELHR
ncbi:prolyl oligopeptidase family serine peptidase [Actinokineospora auranticolor]|uniref:Dipeptidyl aminopeptidase/acylaminoacyl peptidase n=1 Tax=Actinokineospora auranticolor TaxID=155976 RepID=A0A2S6GJ62_9PSEU|nr:prolyl oligopeptidase family serine peptidase [Actinokineospora auranticolor]PPK65255.1 dipeptidyl aminopeptidase/acylaminoacyl peptidase [Actinokineospora auranticolor]